MQCNDMPCHALPCHAIPKSHAIPKTLPRFRTRLVSTGSLGRKSLSSQPLPKPKTPSPSRLSLHAPKTLNKLYNKLILSSPICLSSLSSNPNLAFPKPAQLPRRQPPERDTSPDPSDGSCCGAAAAGTRPRCDSGILVLNRCHHAFHLSCLSSWFEYRHYRCPICQASYTPTDARPNQ
jgi:hypothetical protein